MAQGSEHRPGLTAWLAIVVSLLLCGPLAAQTRIMPLGDSITNGGQQHVSYRYTLWQQLNQDGFDVDFVGRRITTNDANPNLDWYPDYYTTFDRDHEGYWGWRTDEIAGIVIDAAVAAQPDIVLIHLGTNDIGQQGAAGVANADSNLRLIIDRLRSVRPDVTILLAQVIPIGAGSGYGSNAGQVGPLNAAIAGVAAAKDTTQSPVLLVDQNTGFDLATMMQSDELHPNTTGEDRMAAVWQAALEPLLPDNPPPAVDLVAPADGSVFVSPFTTIIEATASDANGSVVLVEFLVNETLLGVVTTPPYRIDWPGAAPGSHTLSALATDDEGASRLSAPVGVTVVRSAGTSIAIANPSFETPPLDDGELASGPGTVGSWLFSGTPSTFVGIFDPPEGSYPGAGGAGTPDGADGENVAFLFNNGGPAESVSATQALGETLAPGFEYVLTVAIGKFLPGQPYVFSNWGGYRIELQAGSTVIASDNGSVVPDFGEFHDAQAPVDSDDVAPALLGQPLSIRLDLEGSEAPRSTHFDNVRLSRFPVSGAGKVPDGANGTPLRVERSGTSLRLTWAPSCLAADSDYAVYEGAMGGFDTHVPRLCTTGGVLEATLDPFDGDRYYLVVPHNSVREGSYGLRAASLERPASNIACLPRHLATCP